MFTYSFTLKYRFISPFSFLSSSVPSFLPSHFLPFLCFFFLFLPPFLTSVSPLPLLTQFILSIPFQQWNTFLYSTNRVHSDCLLHCEKSSSFYDFSLNSQKTFKYMHSICSFNTRTWGDSLNFFCGNEAFKNSIPGRSVGQLRDEGAYSWASCLSLILGIHTVKEKDGFLKVILWSLHICRGADLQKHLWEHKETHTTHKLTNL